MTPLTLSSPTKASLFWTILWRSLRRSGAWNCSVGTAASARPPVGPWWHDRPTRRCRARRAFTSARAHVFDVVGDLWASLLDGRQPTNRQLALFTSPALRRRLWLSSLGVRRRHRYRRYSADHTHRLFVSWTRGIMIPRSRERQARVRSATANSMRHRLQRSRHRRQPDPGSSKRHRAVPQLVQTAFPRSRDLRIPSDWLPCHKIGRQPARSLQPS